MTRAQAEEELLCSLGEDEHGRTMRSFTVRELEAFVKRARTAGATNNTPIRVVRDGAADIRLVARLSR